MAKSVVTKQFLAGSCYSYILSSGNEALVIDPHISLKNEYANYLRKKNLKLNYIVDTHTHADHFSLAAVLKKEYGVKVLMYVKAISQVADMRLKDNQEIVLGNARLRVIYTPGHTDDAISIHVQDMVFTADVLLIGSVGRTDFQNGSPESMFDTLQKLKTLPDKTVVYPGHDYHGKLSSTIGKEKATNYFLKQGDNKAFVENMRSKKLAKPFNMDNIVRVNQKGEASELKMISPQEAHKLVSSESKIKLLDVRSAMEFVQMHIKDSLNIPLDMLSAKLNELAASGNIYIVLCRTGNRSPMAADMMLQGGMHNVMVMDQGMNAWQKARLPVIKGEGGISLERQVRLIAGILVLFGITFSWLLHTGFIFISIFVSCGLIYAGISDNCLMGMLLMKLPYNKKLYKTKLGGGTCAISG